MKIVTKAFSQVGERMHSTTLPCGLNVHIVPKKGFAKKSVGYLVRFGSFSRFVEDEAGHVIELPQGIQHFIEHLLFESGAEDLSRRFLANNAIVNAYTTTNRTVYYFQTTDDILSPLGLLTEMVFSPAFEDSAIQKEAHIIESEFRMYEDEVEQSVYLDALRALYANHPIKDEVLGTIESIRAMNQDIVELGYRLGYQKGNVDLLIVGDVDVEATFAYVASRPEWNEGRPTGRLKTILPTEDDEVAVLTQEIAKPINIAYVSLSGKLPASMLKTAQDAALLEIKLGFLLESLIGKQSDQYHDLIDRHLANDTLDFLASVESSFGFFRITTESRKPEATAEALKQILQHASATPISEDQFLASRNRMIGSFFRSFNRVDGVSSVFSDYLTKDVDVDSLMSSALEITMEDIVSLAKQVSLMATSVVIHRPVKETSQDGGPSHGPSRRK